MTVSELLQYRLMTCLHATAALVEETLADHNRAHNGKMRFHAVRDEVGRLVAVAACQGHSAEAMRFIKVEDVLTLVRREDLPKVGLHGTKRKCLPGIDKGGLVPGGVHGQAYRHHVHIVTHMAAEGETAGVRGGTDTLVRINMCGAFDAGAQFFLSKNCVYLTSGLWEGDECIGIPRRFLMDFSDTTTGCDLTPLPVAPLRENGQPAGSDGIVACITISEDQAEQLAGRVGFTIEDSEDDALEVEALREQAEDAEDGPDWMEDAEEVESDESIDPHADVVSDDGNEAVAGQTAILEQQVALVEKARQEQLKQEARRIRFSAEPETRPPKGSHLIPVGRPGRREREDLKKQEVKRLRFSETSTAVLPDGLEVTEEAPRTPDSFVR